MNETPSWLSTDDAPTGTATTKASTPPIDTAPTAATNSSTTHDSTRPQQQQQQQHQQKKTFLQRDWRLLLATLTIVICLNVPILRWALYPFMLFSTWIHEMCHAFAMLMIGAKVDKLEVFSDGSGLAHYESVRPNTGDGAFGFVASAGYQGCAVVGFLLLLFRRTDRGPRVGLALMGILMMVSVGFWMRNGFGMGAVSLLGILLLLGSWTLTTTYVQALYLVVAVTTSLNAITSVTSLFGSDHKVNGNSVKTDAHAVADYWVGHSIIWALLWLAWSIGLTYVGFIVAVPGPEEVSPYRFCRFFANCGLFNLCNKTSGQERNRDHREISNNLSSGTEAADVDANVELSPI